MKINKLNYTETNLFRCNIIQYQVLNLSSKLEKAFKLLSKAERDNELRLTGYKFKYGWQKDIK